MILRRLSFVSKATENDQLDDSTVEVDLSARSSMKSRLSWMAPRRLSQQVFSRNSNLSTEVPVTEKSVTFTNLDIREYEIIPSINPGVSKGAALGIGWNYVEQEPISVNDFETYRSGPPRQMAEMKLTVNQRLDRLEASGYTRREIQHTIKSINIARRKRRETLESMHSHGIQEKMQEWKSALSKLIKGLKSKDDESVDSLWDRAQNPPNAINSI